MSDEWPKDDAEASSDHLGHRERLRERFREGGADPLPDYELLELVLFRSISRRDVKPIAKGLIRRFGSLAEVLAAPIHRLMEIEGIGEAAATDIKIIEATAQRMAKGAIAPKQILASWSSVIDYCRTMIAFADREHFRILFLDKRHSLIADEQQQHGTVDHTPVYPREILRRALELSATGIILVHNHPSGDPTPSSADIRMTTQIAEMARPLGVVVIDHIIVGRDGHSSMKGLKLF
jgi:DNA repair protein RadC